MLNLNFEEMKNVFFTLLGVFGLFFIASCEKEEECHECHIAYEHHDHDAGDTDEHEEIEGEIGEFCGDDLADVEINGYVLANDLIVGGDTIPAGTYPASMVHCEEHADH